MTDIRHYFSTQTKSKRLINEWDFIALFLFLGVLFTLAWGASQMAMPYKIGQALPISLDPSFLPMYATRTILRMLIALIFSLLFTFTVGTWAAKSKRAEQVIIPVIDILQSVPVLSFLSITIVGFIALFPNSLLGPECASIFVIFTAQAWNMTLGFYQTLKTIPEDLKEAADMFHLSAWQKFWRIEVPFSMSSLLWNTMMSMSASWIFLVASEAISVSNQNISLPGIGSYLDLAIKHKDLHAIFYVIITMLVVILAYDQLLFRPLIKWSEKFKFEQTPGEKTSRSWVVSILQRTHLLKYANEFFDICADQFVNFPLFNRQKKIFTKEIEFSPGVRKGFDWLWNIALLATVVAITVILLQFITKTLHMHEILHVFYLGIITSIRVFAVIIVSSIIWVPIGVWIGMRPRVANIVQPIAQFLAAFPANLVYPLAVLLIVRYHLNVEIWITPLMLLGVQWYILFNVIAGASALPKDLCMAADSLGVKGWHWWKRIALPGIFPYFITGAITAAGGAWNVSIITEWISWGHTTLRATGLGEYITQYTTVGDFPRIALGTGIMCVLVLIFNSIIWKPLYRIAETRFKLD